MTYSEWRLRLKPKFKGEKMRKHEKEKTRGTKVKTRRIEEKQEEEERKGGLKNSGL